MTLGKESKQQDKPQRREQDAVRRLFSYVLSYKKWLFISMCAMVITACSSSLIALLVGQLTDKGFYEKDPTAIWWAPGALLIISLAHGLSTFTSSYFCRRSPKMCCTGLEHSFFRECCVGLRIFIKNAIRGLWYLYSSTKPGPLLVRQQS